MAKNKTKKSRDNKKGSSKNRVEDKSSNPLWDDDDDDEKDDQLEKINHRAAHRRSSQQHKADNQAAKEKQDDDQDHYQISINSKFAQEFEARKQQQELRQFKEAGIGGEDDDDNDSSSSSSEDEDGDLLVTPAMDIQLIKTIQALKRKDASIYDPNIRFFPSPEESDDDDDDNSDDDDEEEDQKARSKKRKPQKKHFKDVIREQILEDVEKLDQQPQERGKGIYEQEETTKNFATMTERLAYDDEQRQLRKAFLNNKDDNDDDEEDDNDDEDEQDWLVLKQKHHASDEEDDDNLQQEYVKELDNLKQVITTKKTKNSITTTTSSIPNAKKQPSSSVSRSRLVDPRGEVEDGEQFLLEFLQKKKWKDRTTFTNNKTMDDSDDDDDDNSNNDQDDENDESSLEQLEKTEAFESQYNFRFEQPESVSGAAHSLQSYARNLGNPNSNSNNNNNNNINHGLLRRPDETRRERRLARQQRKAEERQAKEEQLRRLKNAKRQELQKKLNQIQSILGQGTTATTATTTSGTKSTAKAPQPPPPSIMDEATLMKLLEGDFDPDQFEQVMKETYNDDFYQQPEEEWKSDADVRKSLKSVAVDEEVDKDLAMLDAQGEGEEEEEYEENYNHDDENVNVEGGEDDDEAQYDEDDEGDDEDEPLMQSKKKNDKHGQKEETEIEKKLKAKMMDELYKLDYEDIVAGIPTRFKYRQVEPNNYGLSTEEILLARDSLLQQVVSIKQMATYREGEYTVPSKKRRKFRELLQEDLQQDSAQQPDDHLVDDYHVDNVDSKQNTVKSDERADPAGGKKKRRRQRKTHKDSSQDEANEPAEDKDDKKQENEADEDQVATTAEKGADEGKGSTKSKRRRKKRKSNNATETGDSKATLASPDVAKSPAEATEPKKNGAKKVVPPPPPATSKSVESVKVPEGLSDKKDSDEPLAKKKKNKKKKNMAVQGVSATRFASYGLALAMLVMVVSLDQVPRINAFVAPTLPLWKMRGHDKLFQRLAVRLREQSDPNSMKLREIQAELKGMGVSYADCFDRESLTKKLLQARQGTISQDANKPSTATAEREATTSPGAAPTAAGIKFDRSAVVQELRSKTVRELREECSQRHIRWANFIEKEDLVQALVEARATASSFSISGVIVPGQVADLTDEQLTIELDNSKTRATPLLLDVYATWCGPCQIMAPQLALAAQELGATVRVAKLDSDRNPTWPSRLKIGALPTVIMFDAQGREIDRVEGALMKDGLVQFARRHAVVK